MSATPKNELAKKAEMGKIKAVYIPARHHGFPVPEPELMLGEHCKLLSGGRVVFSNELLEFIHLISRRRACPAIYFHPIYILNPAGRGGP